MEYAKDRWVLNKWVKMFNLKTQKAINIPQNLYFKLQVLNKRIMKGSIYWRWSSYIKKDMFIQNKSKQRPLEQEMTKVIF